MPIPSSFAIARQEVPDARRASILEADKHPRSPEPDSLGLRVAQAGLHPLLDQGALKLRHGADDLEHEPAGRSGQIEVVAQRDESDTHRLELGQRIHQVLQGSGESVQLPDEQDIELPALSSGHHLVESRPTILRSAYTAIHILTSDLPTTAFDKFAQLAQLHFGVLVTVGRADPRVECYS
jgi:hypothetical protein